MKCKEGECNEKNKQKNNKKKKNDKPLSLISEKLYNYCGNNQRKVLAIVIALLFFAIILVIYKNFNDYFQMWPADLSREEILKFLSYFFKSLAGFFVDFATLPILIVTLMFTVQNNFDTGKQIDHITDDVKTAVSNLVERIVRNNNETPNPNASDSDGVTNIKFDKQNDEISVDKEDKKDQEDKK